MYLQDIHFPELEKGAIAPTPALQVLPSQSATSAERRHVEITFHDGRVVHFHGAPALLNPPQRVEALLHAHVLMLEVEGSLVVYPWSSIRSVEINPAPQLSAQQVVIGLTREDGI
ncbi:MAG: hypothetical protein QM758_29975 [Armatimonas sp.]